MVSFPFFFFNSKKGLSWLFYFFFDFKTKESESKMWRKKKKG